MTLISFDIDGTMVFGSPPGRITPEAVRRAKALGHIVGSASDRPISNQIQLWAEHETEVDFVSLKHRLDEIKERFEASRHIHIGDTEMDRYFAAQAGFDFYFVQELPEELLDDWNV
ncbi:MAG: hypothetical protein V3V35_02505 [Dehalococcoidia bacterium]